MLSRLLLSTALALCFANFICGETRIAIAQLKEGNISGTIRFTETSAGVRVQGTITGMPVGHFGFHIHELGDTSNNCEAAKGHFNPDDNNHGGRDHEERHAGDLGNVEFVGTDQQAIATIDFVDTQISLHGRNSIIGRTLALHEKEDDLGLGGDLGSIIAGNAGARLACAVVGILSPSGPWNSAFTAIPSCALLIFGLLFILLQREKF